jgi:EpsI family protein
MVTASMGAAAALAHVVTPTVRIADVRSRLDLEQIFPQSASSWRVDHSMPIVLPLPEVQARVDAIYNRVLTRTYISHEGYRVMLLVAYGADQAGMGVHLPEVCYPAQGFELVSQTATTLRAADRSVPVNRLVTRLGARVEPMTYWITIGNTATSSRTQQRLVMLRYGFRGQIPDGMLVRVSSIDKDTERAFKQQASFIEDMASGIDDDHRAQVVGST